MTAIRFHLVRHGEAEPKDARGDAARALTPAGRERFAAHAAALAPRLALRRIATSPLARARETAVLLARATGAPIEEEPALAPGASSARELLALGRRLGAGAALVGHNPEIAEALALAARRAIEVRPGTVAAVDADGDAFALAWLEPPRT
ncbi:MAG TPA: histidine phosphatase family protein [Anaeromyxobacter sp.]|nr:histidine phosphatase family protein [Anaeromyxobacter sp.]